MNDEKLLKEVREYLRATEEDNQEIQSLINAAKAILTKSGAKEDIENPQYVLCIKLITSQFYEKRMPASSNVNKSFVLSLNSLITQLSR